MPVWIVFQPNEQTAQVVAEGIKAGYRWLTDSAMKRDRAGIKAGLAWQPG